jgi:hypothetical protein
MTPSHLIADLSVVQKCRNDGSSSGTKESNDRDLIDICVSIRPPSLDVMRRGPADICCVVDVSGSMANEASVANTETSNLTILDIVKHAINTIIETLNGYDRLSVVTFSTEAQVILDNVVMDDNGKDKAKKLVAGLQPKSKTNLWGGLLEGMNLLAHKSGYQNSSVLVFTDGIPNIEPEGGHLNAMQRFKDENGGHYPGPIHMFGFGYKLQSGLLHDMAIEGSGTYNFIPDSGFVGTIFVNSLANQLSSYGTLANLSLQLVNEDAASLEMDSFAVNGSHVATSWGVSFDVGNLMFGQQRDFVIQARLSPEYLAKGNNSTPVIIEATLLYKPLFAPSQSNPADICIEQASLDTSYDGILNLEAQKFRMNLIHDLTMGYEIGDSPTAREVMLMNTMQSWLEDVSSRNNGNSTRTRELLEYVTGLMDDLVGQIRTAHSEQNHFYKWGVHYLPSLRCAHQRQLCNNFKDPGVQHYGGDLFRTIRDFANEVFVSLPPPTPSGNKNIGKGSSSASSSTPPVDMRVYHNASAGCFEESGVVTLSNGKTKLIRDITAGDIVVCDNKSEAAVVTAAVECVIRTECTKTNTADFVELENGLILTPWHPVYMNGQWQFPMNIAGDFKVMKAKYVYNFVLGAHSCNQDIDLSGARGQSMIVNGIKCITLAHDIVDDEVASHDFYGTDAVLKSLQQYEGYKQGLVEMRECDIQRDSDTGLVCGFGVESTRE